MRPRIVASALQEIARDPEIARGMFQVLEAQALIAGESPLSSDYSGPSRKASEP